MKTTTTKTTTLTLTVLWIAGIAFVMAVAEVEEDIYAKLTRNRKLCSQQQNLTAEDFALIMNHQLYTADTRTAATPKRLQCYTKCYMTRTGLYVDGQPNIKHFDENLHIYINSKEKAKAAIAKCSKFVGSDECEIAFNFMLCIVHETGIYV